MVAPRDPETGRFKKGVSGNPGGRPAGITALIDSAVGPDDWKDLVAVLLREGKRGDLKAIEILFDRYYGKAIQKIAPTDPTGENPYMGAEVGDLIDLANKISGASK
jgi:hypothetical protein